MFQGYFRHYTGFLSYRLIVYRVPQKNMRNPKFRKEKKGLQFQFSHLSDIGGK